MVPLPVLSASVRAVCHSPSCRSMSPFITTVIERGVAAPDVDDGLVAVLGLTVPGVAIGVVFGTREADDVRGGGGADAVSSVALQAPSSPSSAAPASATRRCAPMVSSVSC
jgi:hypothetical protein